MSHKERQPSNTGLPRTIEQNPAPVLADSQQYLNSAREEVELILKRYMKELTPSNYVAQIVSANYTVKYQALIEQIAILTIEAEETALDGNFKFTRSEFLYQVFGNLVFPRKDLYGIPEIPGDVSYRDFLQNMVDLLLSPATVKNNETGVQLMTDALVTIVEKVIGNTKTGAFWDGTYQFEFEVNVQGKGSWTFTDGEGNKTIVEGDFGTGFPTNPFLGNRAVAVLQANADIVLRALKPAHAIYQYRHVFVDATNELSDSYSSDNCIYYYEDLRKNCEGFKNLQGVSGNTLTDRTLFSDVTRDFKSIRLGSTLEILTGPNSSIVNGGIDVFRKGLNIIVEILRMPFGEDPVERAYTTSPTGLSGFLTVSNGGSIEDLNQDFSSVVEGEVLTISVGPNLGNYRMDVFEGLDGGKIGVAMPTVPITKVQVSQSLLRIRNRMTTVATDQEYTITLDHLGILEPTQITMDDVSSLFYL